MAPCLIFKNNHWLLFLTLKQAIQLILAEKFFLKKTPLIPCTLEEKNEAKLLFLTVFFATSSRMS